MKLTKYTHACVTLEIDSKMLVIDPGSFSSDFIPPAGIVGIVITHEHGDHLDSELIAACIDKNPDAIIVGPESVTAKIEAFTTKTVVAGDHLTIGAFDLQFFGGEHAEIHRSIPVIPNLAVMVNDLFYYAGDSYTLPQVPVDALAVPAGAPWLKIGEAMDYLAAIKPRLAFPTHDAVLSDMGKSFADTLLGAHANRYGIEYRRLDAPVEL